MARRNYHRAGLTNVKRPIGRQLSSLALGLRFCLPCDPSSSLGRSLPQLLQANTAQSGALCGNSGLNRLQAINIRFSQTCRRTL